MRIAQNDLRLILDPITDADQVRDTMKATLPRLVAIYGAASATLAANWYDDLRDATTARRRFIAIPAELPDIERTDSLAGWAVTPLYSATPDMPTALALVGGGLQRIITDAARQTVTQSSVQDRAAQGWTWASSGGCPFCVDHDGDFFTGADDELRSHDNCQCLAAPAF